LVAAEHNLGFPARESEIRKFGWSARRIIKTTPRKVDGRSFAVLTKMDGGWDSGNFRGRGYASRPGGGEAQADSGDLRQQTSDRINSRGMSRMEEGGLTLERVGNLSEGMVWGLAPLAQSTTSATLMIERGWKRRNKT
jgi:hypothetical protein